MEGIADGLTGGPVQQAPNSTAMGHALGDNATAPHFAVGSLPGLHPNTLLVPQSAMRDYATALPSKVDPLAPQNFAPPPSVSSSVPLGTTFPGAGGLGMGVPASLQIGALNANTTYLFNNPPPAQVSNAPPVSQAPASQNGGGAGAAQQLIGLQPSVLGYLQYQAAYQQLLSLQVMAAHQAQQHNTSDPALQATDMSGQWAVQSLPSQNHGADLHSAGGGQNLQGWGGQQPHGVMQANDTAKSNHHVSFDGRSIDPHIQVGMAPLVGGGQPGAPRHLMQGGGGGLNAALAAHSDWARAGGLAPGAGDFGGMAGHKSNVELVFPRRGRKSAPDAERRTHEPIQITMETMMGLFHLPLVQAASRLGLSPTAIKSVCRRLGIRKWPFRSLSAKSKWRNRRRGDKEDEQALAAGGAQAGTHGATAPGVEGGGSSDEEEEGEGGRGRGGGGVPNGLSLLSAAAAEEELQLPSKPMTKS